MNGSIHNNNDIMPAKCYRNEELQVSKKSNKEDAGYFQEGCNIQ